MTLEKTLYNLRVAKSHYFNRFDKNFPLGKVVFVKDHYYEGFVEIVGEPNSLRYNNKNFYILGRKNLWYK